MAQTTSTCPALPVNALIKETQRHNKSAHHFQPVGIKDFKIVTALHNPFTFFITQSRFL